MTHLTVPSALLGATALCLALAAPAGAQMSDASPVTEDAPGAEPAADTEVAAAEIDDRGVVTETGEEIGSIERVVVIGGEPHAMFERGGLFGIGTQDVVVPASLLEMRGDELVLVGLNLEEFETMPKFEGKPESELVAEDTVLIGSSD
jgi:hypothetical protein